MTSQGSDSQNWQNMHYDILVKIFMALRVTDLIFVVSKVCSSWRAASRDQVLWETLDLNILCNAFDILPSDSNGLSDGHPSWSNVMRILNNASILSCKTVKRLIFNYSMYLKDEHLEYAATRFPMVKHLALPPCNGITVDGFHFAIQWWKGLESLTVPFISNASNIMQMIGANCKNFSMLKVMFSFDLDFAISLITSIPELKVLSLRSSIVDKNALNLILMFLGNLEALNISHCVLGQIPRFPGPLLAIEQLDNFILWKASLLREFFTCQVQSCSICQFEYDDENIFGWYEYDKALWRDDEIKSLAF